MALEEGMDSRGQADRRAGESDMGTTRTPARAPDDPWDTTVHRTELDLEAGRGYNRGEAMATRDEQEVGPPPGFTGPPDSDSLRQGGGDPFSRAMGGLGSTTSFNRGGEARGQLPIGHGDTKMAGPPATGARGDPDPVLDTAERKPALARTTRLWGDTKRGNRLPHIKAGG